MTDGGAGMEMGDSGAETSIDSPRQLGVFEQQRPRLMGISYRILGSLVDAEDVLQETWIRWSRVEFDDIDNPEAMLTTIATRLALDRLRRVRVRRETYTGPWLPEPVVQTPSSAPDPAAAAELADSLSMALLVLLETLSPLERAAFVLRVVFDCSYSEVAHALDRSEPAVRQLVHRAQEHLDEGRARFEADRSRHDEVVRRFTAACQTADLSSLLDVLAPDVVIVSDGGGLARAPRRPVNGRDNVARLLMGFLQRSPEGAVFGLETFNGSVGIVGRVEGEPVGAMAVRVSGDQVESLQLLVNPVKLGALRPGSGTDIL